MRTRFTELVGCTVPVQLAAIPGVGTPALAAAVADAGGLGMVGMPMAPAPAVAQLLDHTCSLTRGSIGFNQLMPFLDRAAVTEAARRARVVEFFYGDPDRALVDLVHAGGALCSWQVASMKVTASATVIVKTPPFPASKARRHSW